LGSSSSTAGPPAKLSKTLWVGDLDQTSTEEYLKQIFSFAGSAVVSVKLIRDKVTFLPSGYGFVELISHEAAKNILEKFNGKPIPSFAGKRYRLNWASFGIGEKSAPGVLSNYRPRPAGMRLGAPIRKPGLGSGSSASSSSYSLGGNSAYLWTNPAASALSGVGGNATLFVGNLHPTTTSEELAAPFQAFGEVRSAKVVEGKGYGFVEFTHRYAAETSLHQMHGQFIGPNRVRLAWGHGSEKNSGTAEATPTAEDPYGLGYDPNAYAAALAMGYGYGGGYGYPWFGDGSGAEAYGMAYEGTGEAQKLTDSSSPMKGVTTSSNSQSTTQSSIKAEEKEEIDFTKPVDLHFRNQKFIKKELDGLLLGILGTEGFRTLKDLQRLRAG